MLNYRDLEIYLEAKKLAIEVHTMSLTRARDFPPVRATVPGPKIFRILHSAIGLMR